MKPKPNPATILFYQIRRYSVTIFLVILVGGLGAAVMMLNEILNDSTDVTTANTSSETAPPDTTISTRLDQLHTSDAATADVALPEGRINPFAE